MGLCRVPELFDEWVLIQNGLHDAALNAFPPAMNETHETKARRMRRRHILVDNGRNISGIECVKVERVLDRNVVRHTSA